MGAHAFLSPSFAHIGYKCPAAALRSFQVKQRMELLRDIAVEFYGVSAPKDVMRLEAVLREDNTMADEGTALHTVFEDCMNDHKVDKIKFISMVKSQKNVTSGTKGDAFLLDRLWNLIETQREFVNEWDWFEVEKKIQVRGLPQFGTVDLIGGKGKTLHVRDLKTGYNEVIAEDNEQLMTYAVGLLDEGDNWEKYDKVEIQIMGVRWASNEWITSVKNLKSFKQKVMYPAFMAAYSINPSANPGDHCRYCAGKIHCGEWIKKFKKQVNEPFSQQDIMDLDNDGLVDLFKLCKQGEALAKQQLGPEIMQRFEGFEPPTGIKRVSGREVVKFSVPEEEVVKKLRKRVMSKSELYKQELMTPKQLQVTLDLDDEDLKDITSKTTNKPYLKV